jgi:hypothetical protein
MSIAEHEVDTAPCFRHPSVQTALRCGKCEVPICTRCLVQTPVGARCPTCANLKRLPQFDLGPWLLARSTAAGLGASVVGWYLVGHVAFLRYFLCFLVGVAVGECMSRLALRRTGRSVEVAAVVAVVVGLLFIEAVRYSGVSSLLAALENSPQTLINVLLPGAIASFVAVVKLR